VFYEYYVSCVILVFYEYYVSCVILVFYEYYVSCVIWVCLKHVKCRGDSVWVSQVVECGFL
jgi:hypothetical protein